MIGKVSKKVLLILGAIVLLFLVACGDSDSSGEPDNLTMYIGVVEEQALRIAQQFEEDTGISVDFVRMSGGEILSRIRAEQNNPNASVWYGGPADSFVAAKNEGLLHPYVSPNAEAFADEVKDPEGYWTGIYQEVLGFVMDDRFFEENGIDKPTSWEDILKPEFENRVTVANPGSSGTAFLLLSAMVQSKGEEEGLQFMKELDRSIMQYTTSGSAPAMQAGLGEAAVGITFIHNGLRHIEEGFDNISVAIPEEGTGYSTAAVGIIEGAPELEAAKIFIDWALTKEVQEIGQQFGSYQFPTNPEANIPEPAKPYADFELLKYDLEWSGENRARLVEEWNGVLSGN